MHVRRVFGAAAVWRRGVCAGTIDSSSGRDIEAPSPRNTVRLDRCFFVINIMPLLTFSLYRSAARRRLYSLFKCIVCDDPSHQRRKSIVGVSRFPEDRTYGGFIVIMNGAAESVGHQLLDHGCEYSVGARHESVAEARRAIQLGSIHHFGRGVDRNPLIHGPPLPD